MPGRVTHNECPLCDASAEAVFKADPSRTVVKCRFCGSYTLTFDAINVLQRHDAFHLISGFTRREFESGERLTVSTENVVTLIGLAPKTMREKRQQLLKVISGKTTRYEEEIRINVREDCPYAFVKSRDDMIFVMRSLQYYELATWGHNANDVIGLTITVKGWDELDSIQPTRLESRKAFVAMANYEGVDKVFAEGVAPAVSDNGFDPIRVEYQEHSDSIFDRIIAEIKEARFMVADFTAHRQNVYYEAGVAFGLGLKVIWCCREDHLKDTHFDIRGFNTIVWTTPEELKTKLDAKIRAGVGRGPKYVEPDTTGGVL